MAAPKVLVVDDSWTDLALMATPLAIAASRLSLPSMVMKRSRRRSRTTTVHPVGYRAAQAERLSGLPPPEADGRDRNIPIILISGKNTPLDVKWGMQQGADLYLPSRLAKRNSSTACAP